MPRVAAASRKPARPRRSRRSEAARVPRAVAPSRKPARPSRARRSEARSLPGPETVRREALANGMVVLCRENFSSPSVVISGYLTVGALEERPEQAGLADLTASALLRGTASRTFNEIYESLEACGASLSIGSGMHVTSFHGKSLTEDLGLVLGILGEALQTPAFPDPQISRLRGEKLTSLKIRDDNTGAVAGMAFDALAYAGHPYAIPEDGYPQTVGALTADDLRRFHREFFGPRGLVLAVVGSVRAEAALDAVRSALGAWTRTGQPTRVALPGVDRPQGIVRKQMTMAGKSQSDIIVGAPGPSRFDSSYLAAALGNSILGRFGLMGRIGDAVRKSSGLAYYSYSSIGASPGPDPWEVLAGVNPANVDRAIDLIREELRRFTTRRVTAEELSDNQANFIGRLPLQLEANEGVAYALLALERYSLGLDYYQRYADLIRSVRRDQILETAQRFLDADRLAIAVAGPGDGVP